MANILYFAGIIIVAYFANKRGRSAFVWGLLSVFFTPFIIGAVLFFKKNLSENNSVQGTDDFTYVPPASQTNKTNDINDDGYVQLSASTENSPSENTILVTQQSETNGLENVSEQTNEEMIACPYCDQANPKNSKFCASCGAKLE